MTRTLKMEKGELMQIILNDEEILTIYESLLTERKETQIELASSKRKGRGDFEINYLKKIEAILGRVEKYV